MAPNCFVCSIDLNCISQLKKDLIDQGFEISDQKEALFCAKKRGVNAVLYKSGKFVIQGSEIASFIEFYLEPQILKQLNFTNPHADLDRTPRIGVDEAGKGDFFGPLSIGAVYVSEIQFDELLKIGIKDSKKIDDPTILKMSEKIKAICDFESIVIFPERYNELYEQFKNLNSLLAWGHSKAIETLHQKTGCKSVIVDQFASSKHVVENALKRKGLHLNLTQMHKAESDIVVAAASIIARAGFLNGLEKMKKHYQIDFPKGAAAIVKDAARTFISKYGKERLKEVVKIHFKTTSEILS